MTARSERMSAGVGAGQVTALIVETAAAAAEAAAVVVVAAVAWVAVGHVAAAVVVEIEEGIPYTGAAGNHQAAVAVAVAVVAGIR